MEKNIIHAFEEAGFGKAPFHFVRFYESKYCACPGAPIQPGTSCDFCGTGIMNVFEIKSSDGKTKKVGCECIKKCGDKGLIDVVKREQRRQRELKRWEERKAQFQDLKARINQHKAVLSSRPHPNTHFAAQGKTQFDYLEYMLTYGSHSTVKELFEGLERIYSL